jgi:hypothetical protein
LGKPLTELHLSKLIPKIIQFMAQQFTAPTTRILDFCNPEMCFRNWNNRGFSVRRAVKDVFDILE